MWDSSPTNTVEARRHIQSYHNGEQVSVVWRDKTFYITNEVEEDEKVFDIQVKYIPPPKKPPVVDFKVEEVLKSVEDEEKEVVVEEVKE
jgi:DNA-directed RNA polymerase